MSIKDETNGNLKYNSTAGMIQYMEENDLHLVVPKANELFIDLDEQKDVDMFSKNYRLLSGVLKDPLFLSFSSHPSRRKQYGQHVTISLSRNITPIERIAMQAVLGSDIYRELFSIAQYFNNEPIPTVFLEAKPKNESPQIIDEEVIDGSESNTQTDVSGRLPGSEQGTREGVGSSTEEQPVPTDERMPSE